MRQNYTFTALFLLLNLAVFGQSYAPKVGQPGTTAISKTNESLIAWAKAATVERGFMNIANESLGRASVGTVDNVVGAANGSVMSLGDGGSVTLTFETPIENNTGFDLAIFENSFNDTFLELAFVEVSSDGVNFFRFPSHSQTQTTTQVGGFGSVDATYINNLAGKYRGSYGTPFDLDDISDNALLNKNAITHVKIIDVIGTIDPTYATYDSYGNKVNDPYPTPFASSGFDLDAVGVVNEGATLGLDRVNKNALSLYPNPASSQVYVAKAGTVSIYAITGKLVLEQEVNNVKTPVIISELNAGVYVVRLATASGVFTQKLIKK